jgi:hypothetical protein
MFRCDPRGSSSLNFFDQRFRLVFGNPLNNSTAQLLNFSSESSSALDQVDDYDDDGNHDQEMDETAANVGEEAEKPEHDQDNNYSPKHGVPFD